MEKIVSYLKKIKSDVKVEVDALKPTIETIKTNFDEWKTDWTAERAEKLDNLDVPVSTRANQDTLEGVSGVLGDSSARDLTTVMGRLGSIIGYDEQVVYDVPGTYDFTVPDGVTSLTVTVASAGGGGGGGAGTYTDRTFMGRETSKSGSLQYDSHSNVLQSYGGSGASGGITQRKLKVNPGEVYKIIVGKGGQGGQAGVNNSGGEIGLAGGSSSFGSILVVGGGAGGAGGILMVEQKSAYGSSAQPTPLAAASGKVLNAETSDDIYRLDGNDGLKLKGIAFTCIPHQRWYKDKVVIRNVYPKFTTLGSANWSSAIAIGSETDNALPFTAPKLELPTTTLSAGQKVGSLSMDYGSGGAGGSWGQWADITLLSSTIDSSNDFYNYKWKTGVNSTMGTAGQNGKNGIVIINY